MLRTVLPSFPCLVFTSGGFLRVGVTFLTGLEFEHAAGGAGS